MTCLDSSIIYSLNVAWPLGSHYDYLTPCVEILYEKPANPCPKCGSGHLWTRKFPGGGEIHGWNLGDFTTSIGIMLIRASLVGIALREDDGLTFNRFTPMRMGCRKELKWKDEEYLEIVPHINIKRSKSNVPRAIVFYKCPECGRESLDSPGIEHYDSKSGRWIPRKRGHGLLIAKSELNGNKVFGCGGGLCCTVDIAERIRALRCTNVEFREFGEFI